jgi:hypothetical protein
MNWPHTAAPLARNWFVASAGDSPWNAHRIAMTKAYIPAAIREQAAKDTRQVSVFLRKINVW